MHIVQV